MASYNKVDKKLIELALQDILASPGFANSSQLSNFLSFIVEKTLDSKEQEIKGYTIGVDALGRPEDFDPQLDPSVRVMAGRLRQALENYNRDTGGFKDSSQTVLISLVKGSYVPKIELVKTRSTQEKSFSDKLSALEDTEIDIGLGAISQEKLLKPKKQKPSWLLASAFSLCALFLGMAGYHYYSSYIRIEPTVLPQKQIISIEDATLPTLSIFINADQSSLPDWIKTEQLESNSIIAFSRFNEYRIFDYQGQDDILFLNQETSDYDLYINFSKAAENDNLVAYLVLAKPPKSEVVWSEKLSFPPHTIDQAENNLRRMGTTISEIMSPYGIIHGDITSNKNPPPRLDCIRAIYSYFAKEDLQAYANGLDCARRATNRKNASSSMYAMLTFMYVEAYRKQILEVSDTPLMDADEFAKKAITLDPKNARAFQAMFAVEKTRGNKEAAIKAAEKAIETNPYDRDVIADYAAYLVSINELEKAKPILQEAVNLTPTLPAWLSFYVYLQADLTGDFEAADRRANSFNAEDSPLIAAAIMLSASRLGDDKRGLAAANSINIMEPGFAKNPKAALLRRGFDDALASTLADRLVHAGLNQKLTELKK